MSFVHSKDYVTNLDDQCIQPNAVDLRLESAEVINNGDARGFFTQTIRIFDSGKKEFLNRSPAPRFGGKHQGFILGPSRSFDIVTKHSVKIPEGMVGWCHIRSTLSRNGIILSGGLYDAGYDGIIGFTIHNMTNNDIYLEDNVRIAQFIMATAETSHQYDGYYNQNRGFSK
jgi:deoxycytidine triphosphate deaminase